MKLHPTGKFDNRAAPYERITAMPLASAMGAEVTGVDLADLSDAEFAEIEDALCRHKITGPFRADHTRSPIRL